MKVKRMFEINKIIFSLIELSEINANTFLKQKNISCFVSTWYYYC